MAVTAHTLAAAAADAELRVLLDIPYSDVAGLADHPHNKGRLDLYLPADARHAPVLLWIHGGGLFMGDKSAAQNVGITLARNGWIVANANHRLSPEVSHPVHVQDVARAFAWLKEHVPAHGGNPHHIVVGGHSAGGYLAALLCIDPRWLEAEGAYLSDVSACLPLSGFHHVERLAPERPKHVWGAVADAWPDASPASHVHGGVPPMHLVWAEEDVPERKATNRDLLAALRAAGVNASGVKIPGRDHRTLASLIGSPRDATTTDLLDWLASTRPTR